MLYMLVARVVIRRLGEGGLALVGGGVLGLCSLVFGLSPHWALTLPASMVAGFGFFMFHNTMQTNATQMAPNARGTGVSMFALALFMGQSVGVLLAAWLLGHMASGVVIAVGGGIMAALGVFFAQALRRRDALIGLQSAR